MAQVKQITDKHKEFHSYITLADLELPEIPRHFAFDGYEMLRKAEYHISLVWGKKVAELVDRDREEKIISEIIDVFLEFNKNSPVDRYELIPEFRFLDRGDKKTIIVMAKVKNLEEFFNVLRKMYNKSIPSQPTHITLYTLPHDKTGVGIFDKKQLKAQTRIIDVPLLNNVLFADDSK